MTLNLNHASIGFPVEVLYPCACKVVGGAAGGGILVREGRKWAGFEGHVFGCRV